MRLKSYTHVSTLIHKEKKKQKKKGEENRNDKRPMRSFSLNDYGNEKNTLNQVIRGPKKWEHLTWKKGEHPNRGKFSPDFFIKAGKLILIVEIKGDEELKNPSEENKKKNEYAVAHFQRVNDHLKEEGSKIEYKFNFLTQKNFGQYFQLLREGKIKDYRSELDVKLAEDA